MKKRRQPKPIPKWPIGTPVDVLRDDGSVTRTKTRSEPWQIGSGDWIILVEGISGGYLLERVTEAMAS